MSEVVYLTATVQRLDDEIAHLNKTRAALLRRLNALCPISRALPPETLALIFQHAAAAPQPSHDFTLGPTSALRKLPRSSPLLIGAVCSFWRQIAWSTPVLWTYTDPVPIRRNAQVSDAHLLRLYFANARALPVHIQIKLDRLSSSPSAASEEILRAVFIENSHNIGTLVCTSKSSLRQRWAMLAPKLTHAQFPQLKKVEINLRGAPLLRYDEPMFVNAPALTRVSFVGYHLPHETLNFWEQMTVLELSTLPVSQCLETLVKCTRLQEFRCTSPRPPQRPVDSMMNSSTPVVSLEHLTKFEWVGALAEWDVFLYTYVRLPKLRHLVLGHSHPLSRPLDPPLNINNTPPSNTADQPSTTDPLLWKSFLLHIKSLSVLELPVFHSAQEWLDIFSIFGSTLHTLKFTAFRDAEETLKVLRGLQFTYEPELEGGAEKTSKCNAKDPRNRLPNLKTLHATLDLHPDRARVVLDMLCSRRIRPLVLPPPSSPPTIHSTSPSNQSTVSMATTSDGDSSASNTASSSSSSLPSTTAGVGGSLRSLEDKWSVDPNDYLEDDSVDYEVWLTSASPSPSSSSSLSASSSSSSLSTLSSTSTPGSASSSASTSAPTSTSSVTFTPASTPSAISALPLIAHEAQDDLAAPIPRSADTSDVVAQISTMPPLSVPTETGRVTQDDSISIHDTPVPSRDSSISSSCLDTSSFITSAPAISTPETIPTTSTTAITTITNLSEPKEQDDQEKKRKKKQKTRLEHATIKCWPFGFEFGERERKVCELLRRTGMVLDVVGSER